MSLSFSRWCRQASKTFTHRGIRFSFSQIHQLLAAALGHSTYASFREADLRRFDKAAWALVSAQNMEHRARELEIQLSHGECFLLLADLCGDSDGCPTAIFFEERFQILDPVYVIGCPSTFWAELASELGASVRQPLPAKSAGDAVEVAPNLWQRQITGILELDLRGDSAYVPYSAELECQQLGLKLFGPTTVQSVRRTGSLRDSIHDVG